MTSEVKPTAIALVVCDTIYQEPGGKIALVGLFSSISAHKFPVKHPRMGVFAAVTGVRPKSTARLEIVKAETDQVIVWAEGPFPDEVDPLTTVDMHFIFNNVVFPDPGRYYVRFWGNKHLVLMRPFEVLQVQEPTRS
ncbi:MAG: hypothetical protein J5J06_05150 [Phycisphaerae bacterium]|nr:hypothetical protein [Phycisphaerae bacterium]